MKKLKTHFLIPSLLVSLFFCFVTQVKADTYNYTFNNNPFQYINTNDYNTYKQSVLDYRDTKDEASSLYYAIYWYSNQLRAYLFTADTLTFNKGCEVSNPCYYIKSSIRDRVYYVGNSNNQATNSGGSTSDWVQITSIDIPFLRPTTADGIYFLETDAPYMISNLSDTLNFIYNDTTITFDSTSTIFDAVTLYNNMYGDPYPVISNYFTLIVDKITILVTYFYNNTYLLAIPLIPIFLLCIYLIRRSLIK